VYVQWYNWWHLETLLHTMPYVHAQPRACYPGEMKRRIAAAAAAAMAAAHQQRQQQWQHNLETTFSACCTAVAVPLQGGYQASSSPAANGTNSNARGTELSVGNALRGALANILRRYYCHM
jgi:hypothetical protein